jgi:hypothetical protein
VLAVIISGGMNSRDFTAGVAASPADAAAACAEADDDENGGDGDGKVEIYFSFLIQV